MTIRSRIAVVLGLLVLAAGLGLPAGRGPEAQPAGLVRAIDAVGMTVADAEERWLDSRPRLAIVELMISGGQGTELCRRLKRRGVGVVVHRDQLEICERLSEHALDSLLEERSAVTHRHHHADSGRRHGR